MLGLQFVPAVLATYRERGHPAPARHHPGPPGRPARRPAGAGLTSPRSSRSPWCWPSAGSSSACALPGQLAGFVLAFLLSAAGVFALGLLIAALAPAGKAGNSIGTLLFFPLMFFAGLWTPREVLPEVLRRIADFTPLGAGERALHEATSGHWPTCVSLTVLVATCWCSGWPRPGCSAGSDGAMTRPSSRWRARSVAPPARQVDCCWCRTRRWPARPCWCSSVGDAGLPRSGLPVTFAVVAAGRGLAAVVVTLHPQWERRPRLMAVFFLGLLVLIGLLIWCQPALRLLRLDRLPVHACYALRRPVAAGRRGRGRRAHRDRADRRLRRPRATRTLWSRSPSCWPSTSIIAVGDDLPGRR